MSKFTNAATAVHSPLVTTDARAYTHEGGIGYAREAKSELFLLAASNMVSEKTFYESSAARDDRFEKLIHQVVSEDPAWVARFVGYLRDGMQMRSASIVLAAEYVKAGGEHGHAVVNAAILHADEPAEVLGYWRSRHGRAIPAAIKRGVADAVQRLYTERNVLKYDGQSHAWRFADVIEAVHPTPQNPAQSVLFKWLLDNRHHNDGNAAELPILTADATLREMPEADRRAALGGETWNEAGWAWERLAGWLPGGMDAQAWESVIPQMGYMALLRNLRNFDNAGLSDAAADKVIARLVDPEQVAKSRQFPIRFYSAYREIGSLRWAGALERALDMSLRNVPELRGRTLILIDRSGSMGGTISGRSTRLRRAEIAALFGFALAKRAQDVRVVAYGTQAVDATELVREPLLRTVEQMPPNMGGTNTFGTLHAAFQGHDRVVILTDEQAHDAGHYQLPDVPIFTFNLAGYAPAQMKSGSKSFTFGGLSDAAFRLVPMLERSRDGVWPF